jgi:hypothetical protein
MNDLFRRKLEAAGTLVDTGITLHCTKGENRRLIFMQGESYPIYLFTDSKKTGETRMIFSEDGFPFLFNKPAHLQKGENDKQWNLMEQGCVWFQFEKKVKE